jgi:hypothetical protein
MRQYADSSFIVSCYVNDSNAAEARRFLSHTGSTLLFTPLHSLEVQNALNLCVFRGTYSATEARKAWRNLRQDIVLGRLISRDLNWPKLFRAAVRLSKKHTSSIGTRSLDILHVAAAKHLRLKEFLSFDVRQRSLATAVGLIVRP